MHNDSVLCKKCGQLKVKSEFYKGSVGICKMCRYIPKRNLNLAVWIKDSSTPIEFTGVIKYKFEDLFLVIEDSQDIHYIKIDVIFRIKINKNATIPEVKSGIRFTSTPIIL